MKKYIQFIIASILMAHCAIAQDTSIINNKYFKLVKTYNTLDEVYLSHPELKPAPPKIVINDNEVLFYNDNREIVNRMPVVKEEDIPADDPKFEEYGSDRKIHRNYKVIDDELLGIWESYGYWDGIHVIPFNAMVYDKIGRLISHIKPSHNLKLAPNKEYFASYVSDETGKDTMFVYNLKGDEYSSVFIESYDSKIKFTPNSKFILVYDYAIQKVEVVNPTGNLEFSFFNDVGYLFDFFVSPNCDRILVSKFFPSKPSTAILMDKGKNSIWEGEFARISNCVYLENTQFLLTILEDSGHKVALVDSNGDQLNKIKYDEIIFFNEDFFLITIGEEYYEYKMDQ